MAAATRFPNLLSSVSNARHCVGCVDLMHKDLLVRLFYPCEPDSPSHNTSVDTATKYCQWLPSKEYATGFIDMVQTLIPSMPLPPEDILMSPTINAIHKAPIKLTSTVSSPKPTSSRQYPVAILSHGLGGNRCMYSATSIGLAAMGYVVANVEHRDESASTSLRRIPGPAAKQEGRFEDYVNSWIPFNKNCGVGRFEKNVTLRRKQAKIRRQDVSEALDILQLLDGGISVDDMTMERFDYSQFVNQLDTEQCFVIGHSFGGATAIHALYEDNRFRCGIALDPNLIPVHDEVYSNGLDQPLLFINSQIGYQWKENIENIRRLLKPKNDQGVSQTPVISLRGTTHFGFSDFPHAVPGYGNQPLDVNLQLKLVVDLTVNFVKRLSSEDNDQTPPNGDEHGEGNKNIIPGFVIKD